MRVLNVIGKFNVGGAENYILNLYRSIDKSNIQFDFLVHGDDKGIYEDEAVSLGATIYRISSFNPLKQKHFNNQFIKLIKDNPNRWDVIEVHSEIDAANILKICKKFHIRCIVHSHSASSGKGIEGLIRSHYFHKLRKYVDIPFACSQEAAINRYGKKIAKRTFIVNNGIDVNKFAFNIENRNQLRKELNIPLNDIVYGHVGRFHVSKNHAFLIDIFNQIHIQNPHSYLVLVGDGELKNAIAKKVQDLKLDNFVIFAGSQHDTYRYYSLFDCLIMPSIYEGIPLTIIEAQANGLTIFASDKIDPNSKITQLVNFIPLSFSSTSWADTISHFQLNMQRNINQDSIKKSYDISQIASWYLDFIKSLGEHNDNN